MWAGINPRFDYTTRDELGFNKNPSVAAERIEFSTMLGWNIRFHPQVPVVVTTTKPRHGRFAHLRHAHHGLAVPGMSQVCFGTSFEASKTWRMNSAYRYRILFLFCCVQSLSVEHSCGNWHWIIIPSPGCFWWVTQGGLEMDTFSSAPTSYRIWKHAISAILLLNPNLVHSHFPHNFWSSYEYILNYQSEDSCACSGNVCSYTSPQIMLRVRV